MDLSNFKSIFQKLSVFRNTSLLIPVVIVLVSILLFIPTLLISSELKKKIQTESIDKGLKQVDRLREKGISEELLKKKTEQLQTVQKDANEIQALAVQTNQRQMLVPEIFDVNDPNKLSPLIFLQFGQKYRVGIEQLIINAKIAGAKRAGDCPTQAELTRAVEESGATTRSRMGMGRDLYDMGRSMTTAPSRTLMPGRVGGYGSTMMMGELERLVVDQVCKKRAEELSFYVTPEELSGYTFWEKYDINIQKTQAVEDCWYYQLAYWVIEDVFDTITTMNAGYDNLLNAPVKRLERVNFTMDINRMGMGMGRMMRGRAAQTTTATDDRPKYVLSTDKQTWLTEPYTGRYCGDEIDVIHFNVVCIVSTNDFMPFIQELCSAREHKYIDKSGQEHTYKHNQITVLETNYKAVNKEDVLEYENYRYGESGVIELDLMCEYILNKKGYEDIKPLSVKTALLPEEGA